MRAEINQYEYWQCAFVPVRPFRIVSPFCFCQYLRGQGVCVKVHLSWPKDHPVGAIEFHDCWKPGLKLFRVSHIAYIVIKTIAYRRSQYLIQNFSNLNHNMKKKSWRLSTLKRRTDSPCQALRRKERGSRSFCETTGLAFGQIFCVRQGLQLKHTFGNVETLPGS